MPSTRRLAFLGLLGPAGAAVAPAAWAQANDPSFRVTNIAPGAINEIYVSSAAANAWGPDRLGERTLGTGASTVVRLPPGQCVNDVRIVYANGTATERRRVNTCSITDMVFP